VTGWISQLGDEDGMTLVEVLVALVLLLVGIMAFIQTLLPVQRFTRTSEFLTVESNVAEQELQRIVALGYVNVGLSTAPSHSSDPNNPNYYVGSSSPATFQYDRDSASNVETVCTASTSCSGSLSPGPSSWTSGTKSGSLYRYVTWVNDPCDPNASPSRCPTATDYKRVTIAVTHNGTGYPRKPYLISTIVANPSAVGAG
jgi:prepilin-type N-terminal cleavage/methylation domain-containing protein